MGASPVVAVVEKITSLTAAHKLARPRFLVNTQKRVVKMRQIGVFFA
jgi:hypothetical protein